MNQAVRIVKYILTFISGSKISDENPVQTVNQLFQPRKDVRSNFESAASEESKKESISEMNGEEVLDNVDLQPQDKLEVCSPKVSSIF